MSVVLIISIIWNYFTAHFWTSEYKSTAPLVPSIIHDAGAVTTGIFLWMLWSISATSIYIFNARCACHAQLSSAHAATRTSKWNCWETQHYLLPRGWFGMGGCGVAWEHRRSAGNAIHNTTCLAGHSTKPAVCTHGVFSNTGTISYGAVCVQNWLQPRHRSFRTNGRWAGTGWSMCKVNPCCAILLFVKGMLHSQCWALLLVNCCHLQNVDRMTWLL